MCYMWWRGQDGTIVEPWIEEVVIEFAWGCMVWDGRKMGAGRWGDGWRTTHLEVVGDGRRGGGGWRPTHLGDEIEEVERRHVPVHGERSEERAHVELHFELVARFRVVAEPCEPLRPEHRIAAVALELEARPGPRPRRGARTTTTTTTTTTRADDDDDKRGGEGGGGRISRFVSGGRRRSSAAGHRYSARSVLRARFQEERQLAMRVVTSPSARAATDACSLTSSADQTVASSLPSSAVVLAAPSHCAPTPLASTPSRLQTHARSSTAAGSPVKLRAAVAAR